MLHRRTSSSPQFKTLLEQWKLWSFCRTAIMILRKTVPTFVNREKKHILEANLFTALFTLYRIHWIQLLLTSRNGASLNDFLFRKAIIAQVLIHLYEMHRRINTRMLTSTPWISWIGWLQYLHKTTSLFPLLAFGHLWSSYRMWFTQKYFPQKLHFIGRISLCLQREQCSPKSSNSILKRKKCKLGNSFFVLGVSIEVSKKNRFV